MNGVSEVGEIYSFFVCREGQNVAVSDSEKLRPG